MEAIPLLALVPWAAVWIWAIFDIGHWDDATWQDAGESKTVWFLLVLIFQFFGLLFYLLNVRRKLLAHSTEPRSET